MKKMMILLAVVVAVACLGAEGGDWDIPTEKEKFHIFLLIGQSNMAGGIKEDHLLPEDKKNVPHVVYIPTPAKRFSWKPAAHPLHVRHKRTKSFGLGLAFVFYKLEKYELAEKHIKTAEQLGVEIEKNLLRAIKKKLR